jgi:hypothetical protein
LIFRQNADPENDFHILKEIFSSGGDHGGGNCRTVPQSATGKFFLHFWIFLQIFRTFLQAISIFHVYNI